MQLLFADAASGARSPALVRQGQIGEIIAARPQARRRILEDAAGIAGLHSRRHEAELRLKAAEDNLTRVEDVLRHLEAQVESLGKQARQAVRYKDIAAHIRRAEALLMHLAVLDARAQLIAAERQFEAETRVVAERTRLQGEAARALAVVEHAIQPLREEEARRAAALQRLQIAREQVDEEERRAKTRYRELSDRLAELERDRDRGRQTIEDAERSLAALAAEAAALKERVAADAAVGRRPPNIWPMSSRTSPRRNRPCPTPRVRSPISPRGGRRRSERRARARSAWRGRRRSWRRPTGSWPPSARRLACPISKVFASVR